MYLEVHEDKKASTAAAFLESALSFFPFHITKVLTDNGKEFTLKNHRGNKESNLQGALDLVCESYAIDHRLTTPYTPQTNGMVERANGIIKGNTLKQHTYLSGNDLKTGLLLFMVRYILDRTHGSL